MIIRRKLFAESYSEQKATEKKKNITSGIGIASSIGAAVGYKKLADKNIKNKINKAASDKLEKRSEKINAESKSIFDDLRSQKKGADKAILDRYERDKSGVHGLFKKSKLEKLEKQVQEDLTNNAARSEAAKKQALSYIRGKRKSAVEDITKASEKLLRKKKVGTSNKALNIAVLGSLGALAARNIYDKKQKECSVKGIESESVETVTDINGHKTEHKKTVIKRLS